MFIEVVSTCKFACVSGVCFYDFMCLRIRCGVAHSELKERACAQIPSQFALYTWGNGHANSQNTYLAATMCLLKLVINF